MEDFKLPEIFEPFGTSNAEIRFDNRHTEKLKDKKNFCQICQREIPKFERSFFIEYGELQEGIGSFLGNKRKKSARICSDCCKKIDNYVVGLKR